MSSNFAVVRRSRRVLLSLLNSKGGHIMEGGVMSSEYSITNCCTYVTIFIVASERLAKVVVFAIVIIVVMFVM